MGGRRAPSAIRTAPSPQAERAIHRRAIELGGLAVVDDEIDRVRSFDFASLGGGSIGDDGSVHARRVQAAALGSREHVEVGAFARLHDRRVEGHRALRFGLSVMRRVQFLLGGGRRYTRAPHFGAEELADLRVKGAAR